MEDKGKIKVTLRLPLLQILGLIFVFMKLSGELEWNWLMVTLPFAVEFVLLMAMEARKETT